MKNIFFLNILKIIVSINLVLISHVSYASSEQSEFKGGRNYIVYPDIDKKIFYYIRKNAKEHEEGDFLEQRNSLSLASTNKSLRKTLLETIRLYVTDSIPFSSGANLDQFTYFQIDEYPTVETIDKLNSLEGKIFYFGEACSIDKNLQKLFDDAKNIKYLFNGNSELSKQKFTQIRLSDTSHPSEKAFARYVLSEIYRLENSISLSMDDEINRYSSFVWHYNQNPEELGYDVPYFQYRLAESFFFNKDKDTKKDSAAMYELLTNYINDHSHIYNKYPPFVYFNSYIRLYEIAVFESTDASNEFTITHAIPTNYSDYILPLNSIKSLNLHNTFEVNKKGKIKGLRGVGGITKLDIDPQYNNHNKLKIDTLDLSNFSSLRSLSIKEHYSIEIKKIIFPESLTELFIKYENNFTINTLEGLSNVTNIKRLDLKGVLNLDILDLSNFSSLDYLRISGYEEIKNDLNEIILPESIKHLELRQITSFWGEGFDGYKEMLANKCLEKIYIKVNYQQLSDEALDFLSSACKTLDITLLVCLDNWAEKKLLYSLPNKPIPEDCQIFPGKEPDPNTLEYLESDDQKISFNSEYLFLKYYSVDLINPGLWSYTDKRFYDGYTDPKHFLEMAKKVKSLRNIGSFKINFDM